MVHGLHSNPRQDGNSYNPLLQLKLEDALATINSYLSSDIK